MIICTMNDGVFAVGTVFCRFLNFWLSLFLSRGAPTVKLWADTDTDVKNNNLADSQQHTDYFLPFFSSFNISETIKYAL